MTFIANDISTNGSRIGIREFPDFDLPKYPSSRGEVVTIRTPQSFCGFASAAPGPTNHPRLPGLSKALPACHGRALSRPLPKYPRALAGPHATLSVGFSEGDLSQGSTDHACVRFTTVEQWRKDEVQS